MARELGQHCEMRALDGVRIELCLAPAHRHLQMKPAQDKLQQSLSEYFGRHGFVVRTAPDAAVARRLVAEGLPDLAILDVNMPGENGLSLARWLLARRRRWCARIFLSCPAPA
jgi:DNA-binding NarL/FixJ family response regulator